MSLDKTVPLLADPQFCHAERRKCPGIGRPQLFFYLISCFKKYFPVGHLDFFPLYVDKCPLESVFNMNTALFPVSHYHFAWLKLEPSLLLSTTAGTVCFLPMAICSLGAVHLSSASPFCFLVSVSKACAVWISGAVGQNLRCKCCSLN